MDSKLDLQMNKDDLIIFYQFVMGGLFFFIVFSGLGATEINDYAIKFMKAAIPFGIHSLIFNLMLKE